MASGRDVIAVPAIAVSSVGRVSRHRSGFCGSGDHAASSQDLDAAFISLRGEPYGEAATASVVASQSACVLGSAAHTDEALERDMLAAFLAGGLAAIWLAIIILLAVMLTRSGVPLIFLGGVGFACLCWFTSSVIRGARARRP